MRVDAISLRYPDDIKSIFYRGRRDGERVEGEERERGRERESDWKLVSDVFGDS